MTSTMVRDDGFLPRAGVLRFVSWGASSEQAHGEVVQGQKRSDMARRGGRYCWRSACIIFGNGSVIGVAEEASGGYFSGERAGNRASARTCSLASAYIVQYSSDRTIRAMSARTPHQRRAHSVKYNHSCSFSLDSDLACAALGCRSKVLTRATLSKCAGCQSNSWACMRGASDPLIGVGHRHSLLQMHRT
jgi:hypothetical protein